MSFITVPFSWLLNFFYDTFRNYGVAIILFGILVKLIMLPFSAKSKHSMMRTTLFTPRIKELEKKYAGNRQKYQEEANKLYKSANVNPTAGCLWSLIPFPFLIALYSVVQRPLTRLMGLASEQVAVITDKLVEIGAYVAPAKADAYMELTLANLVHENFDAVKSVVPNVKNIDFSFLGLNLSAKPQWNFFTQVDWQDPASWMPALGLFLIPFISAGMSFFSSWLGQKNNPTAAMDANSANSAKSMMYMMPLVSVYICFIMPAAMGLYWIVQSILSCGEEVILGGYYRKVVAKENADFLEKERLKQEEIERKRQETERLKSEGKTAQNINTSKKKLQAQQKAEEEERRAAAERAERAARRARMGIPEPEIPESQVGSRRFARGRAYVSNRFEQAENADAARADGSPKDEGGRSDSVKGPDEPRKDLNEEHPETENAPMAEEEDERDIQREQ